MRRLLFFAIGVCLLWAAAARAASLPVAGIATMPGAGASLVAGDSHDTGDSDQQWQAQHNTVAGITGSSLWTSALVHADLATTAAPCVFATSHASGSSPPAIGSAPHYLRHTPLLI